MYSHFIR